MLEGVSTTLQTQHVGMYKHVYAARSRGISMATVLGTTLAKDLTDSIELWHLQDV